MKRLREIAIPCTQDISCPYLHVEDNKSQPEPTTQRSSQPKELPAEGLHCGRFRQSRAMCLYVIGIVWFALLDVPCKRTAPGPDVFAESVSQTKVYNCILSISRVRPWGLFTLKIY